MKIINNIVVNFGEISIRNNNNTDNLFTPNLETGTISVLIGNEERIINEKKFINFLNSFFGFIETENERGGE